MKKPACGLLYGNDIHHLDHIAPFCAILGIPLILTDTTIQWIAAQNYPDLNTCHIPIETLPEQIVPIYDVLFSCLPTQLLDPIFSFTEHSLRKKLLYSWLPHGNSDKDNLAALMAEKHLLVYGNQMKDTLKRKAVVEKVRHITTIGNFRRLYYLKYKDSLDRLAAHHTQFKHLKSKTILYAPTWGTRNLAKSTHTLLHLFPSDYNLLIKFHPNTLSTGFALAIKEAFSEKDNIRFIDDFPSIYPLLNHTEIYIGDHSSIAYDFLSFNRPLYYFTNGKTPIHHTGAITTPEDLFKQIEQKADIYAQARHDLYHYAFDDSIDLEQIPSLIDASIERYFQEEPHILD